MVQSGAHQMENEMAYSLTGERPIAAAWPMSVFVAAWAFAAQAVKARRRRVVLQNLIEMDEYRLWDLGISREDLRHALRSDDLDIDLIRDSRRGFDVIPPR